MHGWKKLFQKIVGVYFLSIHKAVFARNNKFLKWMNGCCFYKKPITWISYFTLSWIILILDEVDIANATWIKALHIYNLASHLKTNSVRRICCWQRLGRKTYDINSLLNTTFQNNLSYFYIALILTAMHTRISLVSYL